MNAELLSVGTELLLGNILNTDARYLANELAELGINVLHQSVIGDNEARLIEALQLAISRSDIIITSGGLGPTGDDITRETIAKALGKKLILDEPSLERIRESFSRMGRSMGKSNIKQAMLPEGCIILQNDWGTAPGCIVEQGKKIVVMLPGPPRELYPLFAKTVRPYLSKFSEGIIFSTSLREFGIPESTVQEILDDLMKGTSPTLSPYAKEGEVQLRVTAKAATEEQARKICHPVVDEVKRRLGNAIYGEDVENLQQAVVQALKKRNQKIALAESCTGGMTASRITEVSGSSEVFECGVVTYANRVKEALLGVRQETLETDGAVSEQTASQMAEGIRLKAAADYGVGITGIAGPGGGTAEKPVGLVYVSVSDGKDCYVRRLLLGHGNAEREFIRYLSSSNALDMARRMILGIPQMKSAVRVDPPRPQNPGSYFGK
ncbi:MAG TPA: competence/damage-inducible protein A [Ruminococcaceae bacterium]|nr:competence/damage-inducible protein A [Oscillospiraceae bacterium]